MTEHKKILVSPPDLIANQRAWLVGKLVPRKDKDGKPTGKYDKLPFYAGSGVSRGKNNTPDDIAQLVTYAEAEQARLRGGYDFVGYAPRFEFMLTALDFDGCVENGVILPEVEALLTGTYSEFSPSGTGVRAFVKGLTDDCKSPKTDKNGFGFELFNSKLYVSFTGNVTPICAKQGMQNTIGPITPDLWALIDDRFAKPVRERQAMERASEVDGDGIVTHETLELLREAVAAFSRSRAHNYETWINAGLALKDLAESGWPEEAEDMWHAFSARSHKYDRDEAEKKWDGFNPVTVTYRSLFHWAKLDGWKHPGSRAERLSALEAFAPYEEEGEDSGATGGPHKGNRIDLRLDAWLKRDIPLPDFLSGEVIHTASRLLVVGETGLGKTLFNLDWAAAISAGADFLRWEGRRRCRVMYLDGEMSDSLFKERLVIVARSYGPDLDLYAYNRDVLGPDDMPPLNTQGGMEWLAREIAAVEPDLIFFDSIMSLTGGNMSEEDSWTAMQELAQVISSKKIGQVYLHHTGHDASRSYGTKTREWKMTAVIMLTKVAGDGGDDITAFNLEFTKARERKPSNRHQFAPVIVRVTPEGFRDEAAPQRSGGKGKKADHHRGWFVAAYDRLAAFVEPSAGGGRRVEVNAIREAMRMRGHLDTDDRGKISSNGRSDFRRAKEALIGGTAPLFIQDGEFIYRLREGK